MAEQSADAMLRLFDGDSDLPAKGAGGPAGGPAKKKAKKKKGKPKAAANGVALPSDSARLCERGREFARSRGGNSAEAPSKQTQSLAVGRGKCLL